MSTPCVAQKVPANQVNTRADIGWEEATTRLGIGMLQFWHLQSGKVSLQQVESYKKLVGSHLLMTY